MGYRAQYTYPAQQQRGWMPFWRPYGAPPQQYYYASQQAYYPTQAPAYQPRAPTYHWAQRRQPAVWNPAANARQYAPAPTAAPPVGDKKKKVRWGGVHVKRFYT